MYGSFCVYLPTLSLIYNYSTTSGVLLQKNIYSTLSPPLPGIPIHGTIPCTFYPGGNFYSLLLVWICGSLGVSFTESPTSIFPLLLVQYGIPVNDIKSPWLFCGIHVALTAL